MTSIDINQAKYNDLVAHARTVLGLDIPHGITKPALIELISKQTGQKPVEGAGDSTTEPDKRVAKELRVLQKEPKVRIRIHENKDHPKRIPVSVNGVMYTIKPGAWVDVPKSVVEVLRNAITTTYTQHENERGHLINVPHESLQFPFEVSPGHVA